jgi:4-amino-4-deoxy-L-arabinose transferase-like glycosyltransferase
MWFAESAWPTLVVLAIIAGWCVRNWTRDARRAWLAGAVLCLVLMPVVWWLEQVLVTPRERVEQNIFAITTAFQQKQRDALLDLISEQSPGLRLLAASAMALVNVDEGMRVSDLQISVLPGEQQAKSRFRVNAVVSGPQGVGRQHQPTRWEADWKLEGERWRMTQLIELDPITGERLHRLDSLFNRQ